MTWLRDNLPPDQDFLLLTGRQYSMSDPIQEWFSTLGGHRSQTTLQSLEWTLGREFNMRLDDLVSLQFCANLACADAFENRTRLKYKFLWISLPSTSDTDSQLLQLISESRRAAHLRLIYQSDTIIIFERIGD